MSISSEAYVVKESGGPIKFETVQYDKVGEREVLIENAAFSICASDLKAAKGVFRLKPPMILGHEASGTVKQVGSAVQKFKPGDKVILSYNSCGTCRYCSRAQNAYCESIGARNFSGRRADGSVAARDAEGEPLNNFFFGQSSMSRVILANETSVVKVECTDDELKKFAALGCGIQTGAGAIFNVCKPPHLSSIAIFGAGPVGFSAALAAKLTSPSQLILIDNVESKLRMIPQGIVNSTLNNANLGETEIAEKLKTLTNGEGFDFVLDCVGVPELINAGYKALAPQGMVLTVGGAPPTAEAKIGMSAQLSGGRTYRGTHQGDSVPSTAIPMLIGLWRQGQFDFDKLLTFYTFHELDKGIADLQAGKVLKPIFVA